MKKNLFDLLEAGIPAMSADAEGQLRGGFTALMGGMGAINGESNDNCNCNCSCNGNGNCNCNCSCGSNKNCNCDCTIPPEGATPTPKPSTEMACGILPGLGSTLLF